MNERSARGGVVGEVRRTSKMREEVAERVMARKSSNESEARLRGAGAHQYRARAVLEE